MKWERKTLDDCCISIADGDHQAPPKSDSGIPFITISNIDSNNQLDFQNCMFVPESYYDSLAEKRKAKRNDILYSVVGTFGVPAFIKEEVKIAFQRHIAILRPDDTVVIPKFLYYLMKSRSFYLQADAVALGAAQRTITLTSLKRMTVDLTDLKAQEKIASILSAYDDLIENNQKQIKLLEEAAQRLYKEWFVDLRFPGHERVRIVDGVPEGWRKEVIGNVASVLRRGITPRYNENGKYIVVNQKCIRTSILDFQESRKQDKEFDELISLKDGDTLICSTGLGTLGRVGKVYGKYSKVTIDSHVTLVRASDVVSNHYLYQRLKYLQPYFMTMGRGSTQQQELYRNIIEECEILIPPENVLAEFRALSNAFHNQIYSVYRQSQLLKEARDRLLPKLMSGEIEV